MSFDLTASLPVSVRIFFDGGYEQAEKQKTRSRRVIHSKSGVLGRSIKPAQLRRLQEID
jgi:hypothetical protein